MHLFDDTHIDPARFIAQFQEGLHHALVADDEDLATVIDRFHSPDIRLSADGHVMDREKLIAHCRPIRKTKPTNRVEVFEAIAEGDFLAARFCMYVDRPRGDQMDHMTIHVNLFGRFTSDGKMRQTDMLTRMETPSESASDGGSGS